LARNRYECRIVSERLTFNDQTMTDHALIACRVTLETKARVRRLAQRDGITESALIKQLLDVVLRSSGLDEPALGLPDKVNRQGRLYLRMEAQDLRLLQARSEARGMAPATYAALALRSHLRGGTPLPKAEYMALRQAIDQLTALGRSLNQIGRVLNQGGGPALPGRQEVAAMLKVAEALRDHFRALLDANQRSWEDGRANTTH
jgi:hypothetical protein